jgi:hypothetical protein
MRRHYIDTAVLHIPIEVVRDEKGIMGPRVADAVRVVVVLRRRSDNEAALGELLQQADVVRKNGGARLVKEKEYKINAY